jgi:hypothetical protein
MTEAQLIDDSEIGIAEDVGAGAMEEFGAVGDHYPMSLGSVQVTLIHVVAGGRLAIGDVDFVECWLENGFEWGTWSESGFGQVHWRPGCAGLPESG